MLESRWQKHITESLALAGCEILNIHGNGIQKSGWPDLFVASVAWSGWLELKVKKRRATPLQAQMIRKLRIRGVDALVFRRSERLLHTLEGPDGIVEHSTTTLEPQNKREYGRAIISWLSETRETRLRRNTEKSGK